MDPSVRDLTAALGKRLSLTVEEDVGLDLDDGDEAQRSGGGGARWCLVGTVLTRKKYNLEAMENTLAGIWRPVKGMHMSILGNNFFAFYFFHPVDMQRVLAVGPWRFANHVMVLQESAAGRPVKKEDLFEVPFWIQIHGLPPDRLTAATGRRIGGALGRLVDVDTGDGIGWGVEYIHIRVFIDSRKPLRRGMTMTANEGPFWVDFCLGVMERPYSEDLRAAPKRGQHDAALQVGRWLHDASGNPVETAARRRRPSQYMEGMPNLGSQKCQDESSPRNWRMIEKVTAGFIDRDCGRDFLENPVNPTDRDIISQLEINHVKIGHHHPIKNAVDHGNNESESTPFASEGHNHRQEGDPVGPTDLCPPAAMSFFCWNCRGLRNPRAVRSLIELVGLKKPIVVFLSETLLDKKGMERVRRRLGFQNCFTVARVGQSGGLAMLWHSTVKLSLLSYSQNHIDMEVDGVGTCKWRFTGYYGHLERQNRRKSWELIRELASHSTLPWLISGDFNDLLHADEKRGGQPQPDWMLQGFQEVIDNCCLIELRMVGGMFTWRRNDLMEKLDRGLVTHHWQSIFPGAKVRLLPPLSSEHSPLWITLAENYTRKNRRRRKFRFEEMWLRDNRCQEKQVKQCIRSIESIRQQPVSESTIEEEKRLLTETRNGLKEKKASRRKDHNTINKLQGEDGVWKYDFQDLQRIATDYFSTLFSSSQPTAIHRVTCCLQPCVSIQDNELLLHDFTKNDITQALFQMHPSKAPGPDGLSPAFFQQFWNIVKEDVVRPCLQFLNHGGALPQDLNFTHIVLIPKHNEPRTMADLRPISLCNVVYRILAKVLANRFKQVLQTVISQEQSAFLPNRLITNNFLIAYEVLHYMQSRKNRKKGWSHCYDQRAEYRKQLHGIRICRQAPKISHLLFADDSFLFLRATETEAKNLKAILQTYEEVSGQVINFQKSSITFSCSVRQGLRDSISCTLNMIEAEQPGRYLGFPAHVDRSRTATFASLKSKFWKRIGEWREQPLSRVGREILIKSVLQSLPTYIMGLFLLPTRLCTDLERIMNRYWWGGGEEEYKIYWLEWRRMAILKKDGGLGFRAMHEFNIAMLGKQGWRLLTNPDSLAARLMKAKYYPRTDFLHAQVKPTCSLTWRSIWNSMDLLKQGCRKLIGNGLNTEIWGDPWLPGNSQFHVQTPKPTGCELRYVSDLIEEESHQWKEDLILHTFSAHEAQLILSLPLSWTRMDDNWTWNFTRHGKYAVRSGYHKAMEMRGNRDNPSSSSSNFRGMGHCGLVAGHLPNISLNMVSLGEYRKLVLSKGRGATMVQRRSETRWRPPEAGFIKINVDGAISMQNGAYGMGAVARNHQGEVLAAMACKGQGVVAAEIAEACSLRMALQWAHDLTFRKIFLETDCVSLVTAINNEFLSTNSSLGAVLSDCRVLMTSFMHCQVNHIRREGNAVAHELAKRALQAEANEYWIEEVPVDIAHLVTGDHNAS
ncbi:hypothetical protein SLEP1_g37084 [Rubroshorea leprosula]|uniref:RNase H type-1 domain-containing protein n=1 Tax=Rubroshorea leprosula TaxID=152421 RepID=A0AAV5KTW2_9ROSI|nr:hypothetical protein SLEP1_g37084 [Rubroshorea leprosula]